MSKKTYAEIEKDLPTIVKAELTKQDDFQRQLFAEEFGKKRKKILNAYAFWVLLYTHRWYIKGRASMTLVQWCSFMIIIGFAWVIVDLFLIPKMCRERNEEIAKNILVEHKAIHTNQ